MKLQRYVCAIEDELLITLDATADRVAVVYVPGAVTRKATGPKLCLRELRTGSGSDQRVNLTAVERSILDLPFRQHGAAGAAGRLDQRRSRRNFHRLTYRSQLQGEV